MDREVLVAEIKKLARELRRRDGPLALLMLVVDPTVSVHWNVVVSARGLDEKSLIDGIREVIDAIRRTISKELWPSVKGVRVVRTDDPFVTAMTSEYPTRGGVLTLRSCTIEDMEISKALVFVSKRLRPAAAKRRRPRRSQALATPAPPRAVSRSARVKSR